MKHLLHITLVAWLVLNTGRLALGQTVIVNYWDRGTNKKAIIRGTIKGESPAGLDVESREGVTAIPPLDVLRVTYDLKGTGVPELDYRRPFSKEDAAREPATSARARKKDLEDALQAYQELEAKLRTVLPSAHRYLRYKAAHVKALQSGAAMPNDITLTATEVDAAKSDPDFFLAVVSGLEDGAGNLRVRFIFDPLGTLAMKISGGLTLTGVDEVEALEYEFNSTTQTDPDQGSRE